jgi:3-hydroxyisobutyrate dehydrogenase-like beta-hydroxyacid dehydrogenase
MAVTIGFIGLGKMGGAISANLLASGYSVVGCDLSRKRLRELEALGGQTAATPEEAAARSRVLMLSVPGDKDTERVLLGPKGAVGGLRRGGVVVDFSTLLPSTSQRMAEALKKAGAFYLDTPISGNRAITRKRGGTLMAGGDEKAFRRVLPILRKITHRQFYLGTSGKGALGKLVMNTVSELNRTALAEGLTFGMAGGIDGKVLLEFLASGSAYSKQIDHKGTRMVKRDFKDPEGTIEMCVKDAEHMLQTARELGAPLPLTALRCQLYQAVVRMGHASDDPASIYALYQYMSGDRPKARTRAAQGRKRG